MIFVVAFFGAGAAFPTFPFCDVPNVRAGGVCAASLGATACAMEGNGRIAREGGNEGNRVGVGRADAVCESPARGEETKGLWRSGDIVEAMVRRGGW